MPRFSDRIAQTLFSQARITPALIALACIPPAHAEPPLPPVSQQTLNTQVLRGDADKAFHDAFEAGDELTEFSFTAAQGVGAYIGEGRRFTRFPRADLTGPKEWANHVPKREGGANATSCIACHNAPVANGAGDVALNVVVDPAHTGNPSLYLERNTLPLFALGIPQKLAEEISLALYAQRDEGQARACTNGRAEVMLNAKGVSYGSLTITRTSTSAPCKVQIDTAQLDGIDADLVIKPFGWKGNHATIRSFTRSAAHNELGLQAVEIVGDTDGDFDGVTHELSVGDMTALTLYMAALERPVSRLELDALGLEPLSAEDRGIIERGETLFSQTGCASCHTPMMQLSDTTFREPSSTPGFFDVVFPDGSDPVIRGLSHRSALSFDLATDQPNNQIELEASGTYLLGAVRKTAKGEAYAQWFTDFKRHDMGPDLSDPSDPLDLGAANFLTRSLAGVGSTGPWMHDGRATTLQEAILAHGGQAAPSALRYAALSDTERDALIAYLDNLVLYQNETEHD